MKTTIERRGAERTTLIQLNWAMSIIGGSDFNEHPWKDQSPTRFEAKNISYLGLKIVANFKVSLFSELQFAVICRNDGRELARIKGKVVRLEEVDTGKSEKDYGIAIEFLEEGSHKLRQVWPSIQTET